jgi:hypothetical protein
MEPLPEGWAINVAQYAVAAGSTGAGTKHGDEEMRVEPVIAGVAAAHTQLDGSSALEAVELLPVSSALAVLQLDCPLDLGVRARRTFVAIERACISDRGQGWIDRDRFCNAVVGTLPYPDSAGDGQPARKFLVQYFGVIQAASASADGFVRLDHRAPSEQRVPYAAACLGFSLLLLCPTRASSAQVMDGAVSEIHRILAAHEWGPGRRPGGRSIVLESELTFVLQCVLSTEALLLGVASSMVSDTVPVNMLATAMSAEMLGGRTSLEYSDFRRWMLQLPHKLHPELLINLDAVVGDRDGAAGRDARAEMSSAPGNGYGAMPAQPISPHAGAPQSPYSQRPSVPSPQSLWGAARANQRELPPLIVPMQETEWWDYTSASGARYYSNGRGDALWQMPANVWIGTIDEISGVPYWYHSDTMERSWSVPHFEERF